ncbi:MAG: hypothetical protein LBL16_05300 [Endomicrobium sp.]|jgi:hypothetical protein|nr:hypothetical protein [Endomicrobium sp.]
MFSVNANNYFALLQAIGHDCAGALSAHNQKDRINKLNFIKLEGHPQTEESLKQHTIDSYPKTAKKNLKDTTINEYRY